MSCDIKRITQRVRETIRICHSISMVFFVSFLLSACSLSLSPEKLASPTETSAAASEPTLVGTTALPAPTVTADEASDGPFLLLQSDVGMYNFINFADLSISPFDPPGPNQQYNLAENLSPSRTQMIFPVLEDEILIYSFITGQAHTTYHLDSAESIFQPEQAASLARDALPGMKYSDEALLTAVNNAFQQSLQEIKWFTSDHYRLSVLPATATSTQLTLDDDRSGMREPLEFSPALVEDYWVGPTDDKILLKKGYMFDPGIWQDDRYYLVDVNESQADPIPLPENADNPHVFWFSGEKIGIIHQPELAGGMDFSVVDVTTLALDSVVSGHFDALRQLDNKVLIVNQDQEADRTTLTLKDLAGREIHSQEVERLCFFSAVLPHGQQAMNCGLESVLIKYQDQSLSVRPFNEAIFLLSASPKRDTTVLVTQNSTTFLLNESLEEIEKLNLEAPPLEVRWLPDGSGFLYRTTFGLYLYQIETNTSVFLIKSDLFGDYRNLNAAWIELEE
ncbi:MAG: hypothetical protein ACOCYU_05045 [Brevefilum sp.]